MNIQDIWVKLYNQKLDWAIQAQSRFLECFHGNQMKEIHVNRADEVLAINSMEYGESWETLKRFQPLLSEKMQLIMDQLSYVLITDMNSSMHAFSQIKMNYKIYRAVERKIEEMQTHFQEERAELKERLEPLLKREATIEGYVSQLNEKRSNLEAVVTHFKAKQDRKYTIDQPECNCQGHDSVGTLKTYFNQSIQAIRNSCESALDDHRLFLMEYTGYTQHPFFPQATALPSGLFDEEERKIWKKLNGYLMDNYWISNRYQRDLEETKQTVAEIKEKAQAYVNKETKKDLKQLEEMLDADHIQVQERCSKVGLILSQVQQKVAQIQEKLRDLENAYALFQRTADQDLALAHQFQLLIRECFEDEYNRSLHQFTAAEVPSEVKFLYLCYLKLILEDYQLLMEEAS